MEKIRWADLTDSDSDSEDFPIEQSPNLEAFKQKYKHLTLPISLFIKNISFKCTSDQEISAWFSQKLSFQVQVARNFKKTMFKGDAKVIVPTYELAYKVLNISEQSFLGRPLQIRVLENLQRHRKQNSWNGFQFDKSTSFSKISQRIPQKVNKPVQQFRPSYGAQNKFQVNCKPVADADPLIVLEKPKISMLNPRKPRRTLSFFSCNKV